ncbi:hypothetical protein HanHA300_Chr16g0619651 [Helianthus annuus]|nr:hypothetical protein HanHA300_Chr16g0619651 [Helianthus annuus]KAJ0461288.1 hypothetical protein HanHA89_Chr16g0670561 [Helianthus annuus]KAJ0641721.1 hypothetical protein HanLR1_Chr16g0630311 [Helianthus annuus]
MGSASHLTPLQLESLVTEGGTSRFWWNSALHYHPPVYAPAALSMNFLLQEVSRFPDMHPAAKSSDITKIDYCDMNNLLQPIFHMLACSYLFQCNLS